MHQYKRSIARIILVVFLAAFCLPANAQGTSILDAIKSGRKPAEETTENLNNGLPAESPEGESADLSRKDAMKIWWEMTKFKFDWYLRWGPAAMIRMLFNPGTTMLEEYRAFRDQYRKLRDAYRKALDARPPEEEKEEKKEEKPDKDREAIAELYRKLLGREPDKGGLAHYDKLIKENGWDISRVEKDIRNSREYARKHPSDKAEKTTETGTVNATIGLNVRTGPGVQNSKVGLLPYGAEVTIIAKKDGWYKIAYKGGVAWVCGRYITSGGTSDDNAGKPDDGGTKAPNKVSQAALDWARAQMNPATATGVNRNNGKSAQSDPTAWNYWCLAFVATAYGRSIPELSAGSAIQSYYKFRNAGKIKTGKPIPAGAPVFWNKTSSNKYGHIAIATGRTTASGDPIIITSGWRGRNGITEMTLSELNRCCGEYLGYGVVP